MAKLPSFADELRARQRVAARYSALLSSVARVPQIAVGNECVYAQYTIEVDGREAVQAALKQAGVPSAVHYPVPLNLQPVFAHLNRPEGSFPVAEAASRRVMSLPMHPFLDEPTQDAVVGAVKRALG